MFRHGIQSFATGLATGDQPGMAQDAEMFRNVVGGDVQGGGQRVHALLLLQEHAEDAETTLFAESLQRADAFATLHAAQPRPIPQLGEAQFKTLDPNFQRIGFDGRVVDILIQQDGRLLVLGSFDHAGTEPVKGLARLHQDGSLDTTFALAPGFDGSFVIPLAGTIQPDGRMLVGGVLTSYNRRDIKNLVRLNADGTLDDSFPLLNSGLSSPPTAFLSLADGRTYLGGLFQQAASRGSGRLIRLTETGASDTSYQIPQPNGEIFSMLTMSNGKLLVCGAFTRIAQANRRYVALLNENGTLDSTFDLGIGAGDQVWASTVSTDGNLWLGGTFSTLNNQTAPYLAKIRLVESHAAITGMERHDDNSVVLHFTASNSVKTTLETSTDLKTWSPSATAPEPEGDQRGKFTVAINGERLFFRLSFKVP